MIGRVALLLTALWLTGCSVQFGYERLDRLIPWYLDDYVDFSGEQYAALRDALHAQLCWHRDTQLPRYAAWLRGIDRDLQGELSAAALDRYEAELWAAWKDLLRQVVPDAARLLADLSDRQVEELAERFELKNREYAAERVDSAPRKQRARAAREMRKMLERWTGDLTDEQERALTRWRDDIALLGAERLAVRRAWQARLLALLRERHDPARLQAGLHELFVDFESLRTPAYQRQWQHNAQLTKTLILHVQASLTPRQKAHITERIAGLIDDFTQLAHDRDARRACAQMAIPGTAP